MSTKQIAVKIYLSSEAFFDAQAKCAENGISMSSLGNLALRQWQPAHHIRREGQQNRPKSVLKRPLSLPSRGGAPHHHMRV